MSQQGGYLGIGNAVGKGIGGECMPIAVGHSMLHPRLDAQATKPKTDCFDCKPFLVLPRKQQAFGTKCNTLTQDGNGFRRQEHDAALAQMCRLVVGQNGNALCEVKVFGGERSNFAGACSEKPEKVQERPQEGVSVIDKASVRFCRDKGFRPSGSLWGLANAVQWVFADE